jgi:hypothetical protein
MLYWYLSLDFRCVYTGSLVTHGIVVGVGVGVGVEIGAARDGVAMANQRPKVNRIEVRMSKSDVQVWKSRSVGWQLE